MNLKVNFSTLIILMGMFTFFACSPNSISNDNANNSFRDKWVGLSEGARTYQDIFEVVQKGKQMDVASCANCTEDFKKEFLLHLSLWDEWIELQSNESKADTKKALKEVRAKLYESSVRINELSNSERVY